jgi:hypothetical protein
MRNSRIVKTFESFINEDVEYEKQISKTEVDSEFIKWLSKEFSLKPETVSAMSDITNDPSELYNIVDREVNDKGYGFDADLEEVPEEEFINEYVVRVTEEDLAKTSYKGNLFNLKDSIEKYHMSVTFGENHKYLDIELGVIAEDAKDDYESIKKFLNDQYSHHLSKEDIEIIMNNKFILSMRYEHGFYKDEKTKKIDSFEEDLSYDGNILL